MAHPSEELDPIGELADEFLDRLRRGDRPSIDDFVDRLPDRRKELRDLLSALITVESAKSSVEPEAAGVHVTFEERPERLGDYRLLREVGRGGMGVVYEAEQVSLDRRVALKILAPWIRPGPQQVQRFLREARSAARLHHPDIVPIFAVGEHEGQHYYAMQFIPGRGLDHVLEDVRRMRTPTPDGSVGASKRAEALTRLDDGLEMGSTPLIERRALGLAIGGSSGSPTLGYTDPTSDAPDSRYRRVAAEIMANVADAVQYAHDQGMLHRDIKPSNLLIDESGKVWVADFGLVKALDGEDLTGTGDLVGTLRYMAPERFRGRCDARSDVYSVGLTLYEMLALRPAFTTADRHRLIHEITQAEPEAIQRLIPTLPRDLATIVQTAIAPDPEDRYATAGRLADDLRRWLRHEPIKARRSGPLERLGKWARRNPAVAVLAATAATAAIAAVAILTIDLARISAALDESRTRLYFQRIALAERSWAGNDIGRAEGMLDETEPRFRRWEWNFLKRRCHADMATLLANRGEIPNALAFSADGSTAATAGKAGEIQFWEATTGKRLRSFNVGRGGVYSLDFGPGGHVIASIGEDRTARIHDSVTGKELAALPLSCGGEGLGVAFSPDGSILAACSGVFWETVEHSEAEGELTLWDVRAGRILRPLEGHGGSVHQAVFSPNGNRLASVGGDGRILVWDPHRDAAPLLDLQGHDGTVMGVAWSPDGRRLVSAGLDETLRVWDASTGAALGIFRAAGERFLAVDWSPDGLQIAAAGRSWAVTVWNAETGRLEETYRGHDREVIGAAYNHDGRLLGSVGYDGRVRIWDARRGQDALAISGFGAAVTEVAIDPRGRWVVAAAEGAPLQLREMSTGRPGVVLTSPIDSPGSVAFSADGKAIASAKRDEPGMLEVWDATDGRSLHSLSAGPAAVTAVAFDPADRLLAAGDARGVVRTWDLRSGTPRKSMQARVRRPVTGLAFVEDNRLAVSTGDVKNVASAGTLTIWDVAAGDVVLETAGHAKGIADLTASPDGRFLATAGWDQQAAVWDARSGALLRSFPIRGLLVWAVAFSPDGDRLLSADNIGRIIFWDVASGSEVLTLSAHSDRIYDLAFTADGRRLVSAGRDGLVKIWEGSPPVPEAPGR